MYDIILSVATLLVAMAAASVTTIVVLTLLDNIEEGKEERGECTKKIKIIRKVISGVFIVSLIGVLVL